MKPEIEELYRRRREADRDLCRLEREIGDAQRACRHVARPGDPNWCQECGGPLPIDSADREGTTPGEQR